MKERKFLKKNAAENDSEPKLEKGKEDLRQSKSEAETANDSAPRFAEKRFELIKNLYKKMPIKAQTIRKQRRLIAEYAPRLLSVKDYTLPPVPQPKVFFSDPSDHFTNARSLKFKTHYAPLVSIVIAVYGKIEYTLNCLASIATNLPLVSFEILVVDDCSPDNSLEILKNVQGVRLLRNEKNNGFIRSCNRAAEIAHGEYICFLNNDTQVATGWLDELVRTFQEFPGTGLVGSKLIYPDGRLQEAGSIIWRDGAATNFGYRQNPSLPVYNYAREVDYCSGASILIPRKIFNDLGRFDEIYTPAYCEDSDLALKIREAGYRIIYQPLSMIIHYQGITSGKTTKAGVKAYQIGNLEKLYSRWNNRLQSHQPFGVDLDDAKDRRAKRRVLLIEPTTPMPDHDAGSVTIFNLMLLLREMDFQVTFIPEDNFVNIPQYTAALQRVGIEVLYGPFVMSVRKHLKEFGKRYDLVILSRPQTAERHIKDVRRFCPRAKSIYYTVDLHFLRLTREAKVTQNIAKAQEAAEMKQTEFEAINLSDATIFVSEKELEIVKDELPRKNLRVLPLIQGIPETDIGFSERHNIVFVGNFLHTPNGDAIEFFVMKIMPLLRERLPNVRFYIAGGNVSEKIKALAKDDVVLLGFIKDLNSLLDKMRVSVAPLRYGAGVKGKIISAMAAGLPVVATNIAAEGMSLVDGRNALLADEPQEIVEAIVKLYQNEILWNKISREGIEFARGTWGAERVWNILSSILSDLGIEVSPPSYPLSTYSENIENLYLTGRK